MTQRIMHMVLIHLCGDDYHLFITLDEDTQVITDIGFHGSGCAISKSVSSMMTMHVLNKTLKEVLEQKMHL